MKVLIPFWKLELLDRYTPQFSYLADELERLDILYLTGQVPEIYNPKFNFIKMELPKTGYKYLDWFMGKDTAPKLVPNDLDLVYSLSGLWSNTFGDSISKHWNIPHVIRFRGDMISVRKHQKRNYFSRTVFKSLHLDALRKATLITPIAEKYQTHLENIVPRNQIAETIPNGYDVPNRKITFPERFTPAYIGRISEEKGSEFLLELIKSTPHYNWVIAGKIQDKEWVTPSNCDFMGWVPYSDIGSFYDRASLVVLPSKVEGFPNAILEAWGHGKPVMGTPDAIPKEVGIFGARIEADLEKWIKFIDGVSMIEPALGFGERTREYVKDCYSWISYSQGMKAVFNKALSIY